LPIFIKSSRSFPPRFLFFSIYVCFFILPCRLILLVGRCYLSILAGHGNHQNPLSLRLFRSSIP
jgi:hypothetical protein